MSNTEQDTVGRLAWALRRYALAVVAVVAATAALAVSGPARSLLATDDNYEASALIVAQELQIKPEQLPRTAEAVFSGGSVAATVADSLGDRSLASHLIPNRIRLEPLNDTIALRIVGRSSDPGTAADLANTGADAFLVELDRLGPGVGVFALQDEARPPERRAAQESVVVPLTLGVAGGCALALGLLLLVLTVRRPVLAGAEAAEVAATELVATLDLPASRRTPVEPESVSGLGLLARQLFPNGSGVAGLIGCGGRGDEDRPEVLRLLALLVSRRAPVFVVGSRAERIEDLGRSLAGRPSIKVLPEGVLEALARDEAKTPDSGGQAVLLGVDASAYDVPQLLPPGAKAVLFVSEGTPRAAVQHAARQFGPGELSGVTFARGRRQRLLPRRSSTSTAPGQGTRPATRPSPAPEPAPSSRPREGAGASAQGR